MTYGSGTRTTLRLALVGCLLSSLGGGTSWAQSSGDSQTAKAVEAAIPPPDPMLGDGGTGPFYQWDGAIPDGPPQIIKIERFHSKHALAEAALSERIMYTSLGGPDGKQPIIVTGAVYLPKGPKPAGGWPIIAWAHGTVGLPDTCAPTFNGWSARDVEYLNNWLRQGYAVVASDYEGMGTNGPHPYMISRSAAVGTLHAILAAQPRYPLSNNVVIVGQSQGAHTAANSGLIQQEVAPSLKLRGVVLTGWPGTMEMPALRMDQYDPWSVFYMRALPTYAAIDPDFRPESVLTPEGRKTYETFLAGCGSAATRTFMARGPVVNTLFTRDITPLETRAQPLRAYPPLRFKVPVFLGIGLADEQTFPRPTFDAAKRACALGSNIAIHMYPGFNHAGTVLRSQEDSLGWVKAVFGGKNPKGQCEKAVFPNE